jgi:hypothetical protein
LDLTRRYSRVRRPDHSIIWMQRYLADVGLA